MSYNGYHNRATWNVILWIMNDEPLYHAVCREVAEKKKYLARDARAFCEESFGNRTPDGHRLSAVKWSEVADAMKECRP